MFEKWRAPNPMTTAFHDETDFVDDPKILEAIEQLKKKMEAVSDNFEANRTKSNSQNTSKKSQKKATKKQGSSLRKNLKYLFLIIFFLGCSFIIAQMATIAFNQQAAISEQGPEQSQPASQMPMPANLMLKTASYEMLQSDIGKTLEITIVVANEGESVGTPKQFIIELVDKTGNTIIDWPMVVEGEPIEAGETRNFVTRLIEPPTSFANIRVSMNK